MKLTGNFLWEGFHKNGNKIYLTAVNETWLFYLEEYTNGIIVSEYDRIYAVKAWINFPGLDEILNHEKKKTMSVCYKMLFFYALEHCIGHNRLREIRCLKKVISKL